MLAKQTARLPTIFLCISVLLFHLKISVSQPINGNLIEKPDDNSFPKSIWNPTTSDDESNEIDFSRLNDEDIDFLLDQILAAYDEYQREIDSKSSSTPMRRANFWKRANFWRKRANFWRRRSVS